MFLSSVMTGCMGSRVWGVLKFQSGVIWTGLISSLNCCRQKDIFSFSLMSFSLLDSSFLLLNTLLLLEGLFGGSQGLSLTGVVFCEYRRLTGL